MKKSNKFLLIVSIMISMVMVLSGCSKKADEQATKKETLTISAAASLKEPLGEIKKLYEKDNNVELSLNLAASGTLQKQIEQGANTDLFISAGAKQMKALEEKNLIKKESNIDLLKNKLVIVTSKDSTKKLDFNDKNLKFSIGTPKVVPAGDYAQQSLEKTGMFEKIKDQIVYAKDVKQVLSYVETKNVDFGYVYKSDAVSSTKAKIYEEVDESTHKTIVYPAAMVANTKKEEQTNKFLKYLQTSNAQEIFKKYGFESAK